MQDYTKQMQDAAQAFADQLKSVMPKVTFNKNGYEIRAQMLEMAQSQVWQDYHAKWGMFETSISKNGGELTTKVTVPSVPGADEVLKTAEQFYNFVNGKTDK
jgi:hypothetical protein